MSLVRPFRAHEVYAGACVQCGDEIEADKLPVPLLCRSCAPKCRYNHSTLRTTQIIDKCPECGDKL